MTIRLPPHMVAANGSEAYTIDFRETAPLAAHETMYVGRPEAALWGGLAVGVPGELRGLKKAHDLWGTVPWAELVAPAAKLAHGWRVQMELERRISVRLALAAYLHKFTSLSALKDLLQTHVEQPRLDGHLRARWLSPARGGHHSAYCARAHTRACRR